MTSTGSRPSGSRAARSSPATAPSSTRRPSPDGKTREIKSVKIGGLPRVLWRDHDDRWYSPTNRDAKLLVSPDGKQLAFVSDRSGWIHVYVMPLDATSEAQAVQLTSGQLRQRPGQLVTGQQAHRLPPQRRQEPDRALRRRRRRRHQAQRGGGHDPWRHPRPAVLARRPVGGGAAHRSRRTRSTSTSAPVRAGAALTRLSDSMPAGLNREDDRGARGGELPQPSRQGAGARHDHGAAQPRQVAQAPGHRVDPRLRFGPELPRLAPGQLPDVLLGRRSTWCSRATS